MSYIQLTKAKPGSIKETALIIFPLMTTALSANFISFFDRIMLAHYSILAMNAVTIASIAISIYQYIIWSIVSVCEIFITESFTRKKLELINDIIFQVVLLCLVFLILTIPLSIFTGAWFLPSNYQAIGLQYYKIMIYSAPLLGLVTVLASYFIGQGKLKIVVVSSILANVINILLDIVLIFGIKNYVHSYGALGAAISGLISISFEIIILSWFYMGKKSDKYITQMKYQFSIYYIKKCIKIGIPNALGHSVEIIAWLILMLIVFHYGQLELNLLAIGNSIYLLGSFITDGTHRGEIVILSSLRAMKEKVLIFKSIKSASMIVLVFIILLFVPLILFPSSIAFLFNLNHSAYPINQTSQHVLNLNLIGIWLFLCFDGLLWVYASVLTAYRDTVFSMFIFTLNIWIFAIAPIYFLLKFQLLNAKYIWLILTSYALVNFVICKFRAGWVIKSYT